MIRFEGSVTAWPCLTASEKADRTVTGLLLPFGEAGRTSAGTVIVKPGTVTIPEDLSDVILNAGHDREKPIGRCTSIEEKPEGLYATFVIADVPRGNEYLTELAAGLRNGLSVELSRLVIRNGELLAGLLTDVGAVVRPAFPSALVAADTGELESDTKEEETNMTAVETGVEYDATVNGEGAVLTIVGEVTGEEAPSEEATAGLTAAKAPAFIQSRKTGPKTPEDAFQLIAKAMNENVGGESLTAALADVVYGAGAGPNSMGNATGVPQWLGKLWDGITYEQKFVPLLGQGTLSGMKAEGYRFTQKATVADWTGDKTAIGGTAPMVERVSMTAQRIAGGLDIDRALIDFGQTDLVGEFIRQMVESNAQLLDGHAKAALFAAANAADPVTSDAAGTDVNAGVVAIIDGALALRERIEQSPTFALVSLTDYRNALLTKDIDKLAYLGSDFGLASSTFDTFKVIPVSDLATGEAIVGHQSFAKFFTLPGAPIRMSAQDIARGGYDEALFSYWATIVENDKGIAFVNGAVQP